MKARTLMRVAKRFIPVKLWNVQRKTSILKQHKKVADFWTPIIDAYHNETIERYALKPKKELDTRKVIWQYWGQGLDSDDLPEIVRICFDSVDKHKADYQVIRLTDTTLSEYLDFPDFVRQKRENAQFNRTFFSDLLRCRNISGSQLRPRDAHTAKRLQTGQSRQPSYRDRRLLRLQPAGERYPSYRRPFCRSTDF